MMSMWEPLQHKVFRDFANLHNQIGFKETEEKAFDEFVRKRQEKMKHPKFLFIFAERVRMEQIYFEGHQTMCQMFYDFMKANPEWKEYNFGVQRYLRLAVFFKLFGAFLQNEKNESSD